MKLVIALPLVLFATSAFADDYYAAPSVSVGGDEANRGVFAAVALDGGYRLSDVWWLHGKVMYGRTDSTTWGGPMQRGDLDTFQAGIEWHRGPYLLGADAALVHDVTDGRPEMSYDGPALALRAGLDFGGGEHVRFRPTFDVLLGGKTEGNNTMAPQDYSAFGLGGGIAVVW
jgi:hypothetical protein